MVELGLYEHFKGGRYKVLMSGLYEPTQQPVVIYEAQYDNDRAKIWVRPETDFIEEIEINGELIPRFKKIS